MASIGQADDVVLLSHDVFALFNLLDLTIDYCSEHHVVLAPEKTKLMVFHSSDMNHLVEYQKAISPISINNMKINFTDSAEHVGITRSIIGNLPHIQSRIGPHMKKLFRMLPTGLARNRRLNPAASLRIESVYASPVLFSGMAALNLKKQETELLHLHLKKVLQYLQRLHDKTPECFINFMAGNPGATAILHMRQLSLFGMICRLRDNILNELASHTLLTELDTSD